MPNYLLSPGGVAVHLDQSIFVDKTYLIRRNANNRTVPVMQVQDVLVPSAKCVSSRSPKFCESSCCRSRNVTQRVKAEPIDERSEDDVNEDDNGALQPDVMQERGQPQTYRAAAMNPLRVRHGEKSMNLCLWMRKSRSAESNDVQDFMHFFNHGRRYPPRSD
jgi:hypothetical protein